MKIVLVFKTYLTHGAHFALANCMVYGQHDVGGKMWMWINNGCTCKWELLYVIYYYFGHNNVLTQGSMLGNIHTKK